MVSRNAMMILSGISEGEMDCSRPTNATGLSAPEFVLYCLLIFRNLLVLH